MPESAQLSSRISSMMEESQASINKRLVEVLTRISRQNDRINGSPMNKQPVSNASEQTPQAANFVMRMRGAHDQANATLSAIEKELDQAEQF